MPLFRVEESGIYKVQVTVDANNLEEAIEIWATGNYAPGELDDEWSHEAEDVDGYQL